LAVSFPAGQSIQSVESAHERAMTALEELKESTIESLAAKQRALSRLTEASEEDFRDMALECSTESVTMMRIRKHQARDYQRPFGCR